MMLLTVLVRVMTDLEESTTSPCMFYFLDSFNNRERRFYVDFPIPLRVVHYENIPE